MLVTSIPLFGNSEVNTCQAITQAVGLSNFQMRRCSTRSFTTIRGRSSPISGTRSSSTSPSTQYLEFIARTMQRITEDELGEEMMKRVETFRDLLARTPVDELEVRERPRVFFRVNENTWLEAIVRYLVAPREAGRVKTRLIKKLLAALNRAPEKVMFPAGANR